jgi:hypothetical protein
MMFFQKSMVLTAVVSGACAIKVNSDTAAKKFYNPPTPTDVNPLTNKPYVNSNGQLDAQWAKQDLLEESLVDVQFVQKQSFPSFGKRKIVKSNLKTPLIPDGENWKVSKVQAVYNMNDKDFEYLFVWENKDSKKSFTTEPFKYNWLQQVQEQLQKSNKTMAVEFPDRTFSMLASSTFSLLASKNTDAAKSFTEKLGQWLNNCRDFGKQTVNVAVSADEVERMNKYVKGRCCTFLLHWSNNKSFETTVA